MSTKSKRKQKRSDIEAKDQNKTKTFWCVSESKVERFSLFQKFGTKPKLFYVFQLFFSKSKTFLFIPKILEQNQNFLMCSNFFLAEAKRYYLIQKLRNRTKTFGFSSLISKNKTELFVVTRKIRNLNKPIAFETKILRSETECFVPIINFVSKTNLFDFLGTFVGKRKQTILKKRWFDITTVGSRRKLPQEGSGGGVG